MRNSLRERVTRYRRGRGCEGAGGEVRGDGGGEVSLVRIAMTTFEVTALMACVFLAHGSIEWDWRCVVAYIGSVAVMLVAWNEGSEGWGRS